MSGNSAGETVLCGITALAAPCVGAVEAVDGTTEATVAIDSSDESENCESISNRSRENCGGDGCVGLDSLGICGGAVDSIGSWNSAYSSFEWDPALGSDWGFIYRYQ